MHDMFEQVLSDAHRETLLRNAHFCFTLSGPVKDNIWRLKDGTASGVLSAPHDLVLRIAAVEIGLDFDRRILRFELRPHAGRGQEDAAERFVHLWRRLVVAAKAEQHEAVHKKELLLPKLPWRTFAVRDMPCVFWVYVPSHSAAASSAMHD